MLQALFLVLGLLGSWGAFSAIHGAVRPRLESRRARRALLAEVNPYWFRTITVGARVNAALMEWRFCREMEVVSKAPALSELEVQTTFGYEAEYRDVRVHPAEYTVETAAHPDPFWSLFVVRFPRSLARGESATIAFSGLALLRAPGRRMLAYTPTDRVDRLTLRVVFDAPPGGTVYFRQLNAQHQILHQEVVRVDPLTHEARKVIDIPVPHLTYQLAW
jgi:hypothetical protein